jgi:predicted phosphodiesterase
MQNHPFHRIVTFLILLALAVSCAPRTSPHLALSTAEKLPAITEKESPATSPPAFRSTRNPEPGQKPAHGTKVPGGGRDQGQGQANASIQNMPFDVPASSFNVVLGRPTDNSITLSMLSAADQTVSIDYGTSSGSYTSHTDPAVLQANLPREIIIDDLAPDTEYFYSINGVENTFHTARASGSTFTFTIQADSHLDSNTSPQVYEQTLANQRADHPDFVIDLGDTFMTEKYKPYTDAAPQYRAQRYFMSQLADTASLFLALGNHDGEGAPRGNVGTEISTWAASTRIKYFPNPIPDKFYTGNTTPDQNVGLLQDYYAWTWGDALFIVLDPYWFTPLAEGNTSNLWNPTLGEEQYQWLKATLEASDSRWKFVFIHQLIGGLGKDGRGGVEVASFHEWGGNNPDGTYGFDQYRPGWGLPIHQLLVENNVNAVFHGHDHLFVTQELDGIIYQECPQPGTSHADRTDSAAEYGYTSGEILGGPGYLRVTVSPDQVAVNFIRASLSAQQNGQTAYSYVIKPFELQR